MQRHLRLCAQLPQYGTLGVKALDDYTIEFTLEAPSPFFPYIAGLAVMRHEHPGLKILMLSGYRGADYVRRALAAGAAGYAVKSDPVGILAAIRRILAGESYISPGLE